MDHRDKLMPPNPANDTQVRMPDVGETATLNLLERNSEPPWEPGQQHGDFQILELLGRGKTGFVYLAHDLITRKDCALKILGPLNSQDLTRNKLGFRRMTLFRHPNLMNVDRIHILDGRIVFAMEYVEGKTLFEAIREIRQWDRSRAFGRLQSLLQDYAVGLASMHDIGLVHRDIKPTNLMVTPEGHGVIVDFGLVAAGDTELDLKGMRQYLAGTPRYFSPEAVWDQYYAPPGDLFALGLVMLECINQVMGYNDSFRVADFKIWQREQDELQIGEAVEKISKSVPDKLLKAVKGMLRPERRIRFTAAQVAFIDKERPVDIPWIRPKRIFGRERELSEVIRWVSTIMHDQRGRLHIYGPSGIGKTRLLDEIEQTLLQNPWCQVICVKCQSRERNSFQVFDQVADHIASRYSRGDREKLVVDPDTASILIKLFPQLRHVVVSNAPDHESESNSESSHEEALAAISRLTSEIRKIGPLFIIVDDAQWSDHASDSVWDALQKDDEGGLGIITVSREPETSQRQRADKKIHVRPLSIKHSCELLNHAAEQHGVEVNTTERIELAEISGGIPYRLQELAQEFGPGGWLHKLKRNKDSAISNVPRIEKLWKKRFERLSGQAQQVLAYVATAERTVSLEQLDALTGLGHHVDAAVSELVANRLVLDDAVGGECIRIVHDNVADGLLKKLTDQQKMDAHIAWANFLIDSASPGQYSSRIARHLFAAKLPAQALPHAILAAQEADQNNAKSKAGKLHSKIIDHVKGQVRRKHICDAARCFREADLSNDSADFYATLASEAEDANSQWYYRVLKTDALLRCGRIADAMPDLTKLCDEFSISFKPRLTDLAANPLTRLTRLAKSLCAGSLVSPPGLSNLDLGPDVTQSEDERRLALAWAAARPMTLFDLLAMIRLLLIGSENVNQIGTLHQRAYFASAAAACIALSKGTPKAIQKARRMLTQLEKDMSTSGDHAAIAEAWAARAYVESMAMQWDAVAEPVSQSIANYAMSDEPLRFEISHVRWLSFWSDWQTGNWSHLVSVGEEMLDDANRRNNHFQHRLASDGFGGCAMLINDELQQLSECHKKNAGFATQPGRLEIIDFLHWVGKIQVKLYQDDLMGGWQLFEDWQAEFQASALTRIPAVTVTVDFYSALLALHLLESNSVRSRENPSDAQLQTVVRSAIRRLNRSAFGFGKMLSALLSGISARQLGEDSQAELAFSHAVGLANHLGVSPYATAAQDGLDFVTEGQTSRKLRNQMIRENISCPEALERLYTVPPSAR